MIEQKQKDVLESLKTLKRIRDCYTCSYCWFDNRWYKMKCNKRHKHLPKLNCNDHKFKQ